MTKETILNKIQTLKDLQGSLEPDCKAFCADESIPVEDRWEVFQVAPNLEHDCIYDLPPFKDVGLQRELSPYDDLYIERHETFDVVDRLQDWEDELGEDMNNIINTKEQLDAWKNHYMKKYVGSWKYDW